MSIATFVLEARETTMGTSDVNSRQPSDTVVNLLIALFGLVFIGLLMVAVLIMLRRARRQRIARANGSVLPQYEEIKRSGNHRQLTIQTSANGRHSVLVMGGSRKPMLANPESPPHSPDNVPEIHITFPDEHDEHGRPMSGRVVVVRVGESGTVGMEPLQDEQLPAYEKDNKSQFYSIDMEKIGGLKEKERQDFR